MYTHVRLRTAAQTDAQTQANERRRIAGPSPGPIHFAAAGRMNFSSRQVPLQSTSEEGGRGMCVGGGRREGSFALFAPESTFIFLFFPRAFSSLLTGRFSLPVRRALNMHFHSASRIPPVLEEPPTRRDPGRREETAATSSTPVDDEIARTFLCRRVFRPKTFPRRIAPRSVIESCRSSSRQRRRHRKIWATQTRNPLEKIRRV